MKVLISFCYVFLLKYKIHNFKQRKSPKTGALAFCVVNVNDEYTKPTISDKIFGTK